MNYFRFHLLGGVTPDEAEAVQKVHGRHWSTCNKCPKPSEAVMLMRKPGGGVGDVNGMALCPEHETEVLHLLQSSQGYDGFKAVRRNGVSIPDA